MFARGHMSCGFCTSAAFVYITLLSMFAHMLTKGYTPLFGAYTQMAEV